MENNSSFFNNIITNAFTGIDSSTWMVDPLDRQTEFLKNLQCALDQSGAAIWTTDHCVEEIRSKLNDPDLGIIAAHALAFIKKAKVAGQLKVYEYGRITSDRTAFADPTFLSALLTKRADCSLALIAQDGDLISSAAKLESLEAVQGEKIYLYRVNGHGLPVRYRLFQSGDGQWICPKRSGLRTLLDTPMAECSDAPRRCRTLHADDTLWGSHGAVYKMEQPLSTGRESSIYAVQDMPQLVVKVFHTPSCKTENKCKLLVSSEFSAFHTAKPLDLVYDSDGRFRGYTMRRLYGRTLDQLMTPAGRERFAPDWNRLDFAKAAIGISKLIENLQLGGLLMLDLHPSNFLFEYDLQSGRLDPEAVWVLDVDSAQFGSNETGIFPADPVDPAWSAPELLRNANLQQLFTMNTQVYHLAITAFQCIMAGLHPFQSATGIAVSPERAIRSGQFPYSPRDSHTVVAAPIHGQKLWSNLSRTTKSMFTDLFQPGRQYHALEDRPTLHMLTRELMNYANWLQQESVLDRFPEVLSLQPLHNKPYYATCANKSCQNKDHEFAITYRRSDGRYYCPQCREEVRQRRKSFQQTAAAPVIPFPMPAVDITQPVQKPTPAPAPVITMPERQPALPAPTRSFAARAREFCAKLFA